MRKTIVRFFHVVSEIKLRSEYECWFLTFVKAQAKPKNMECPAKDENARAMTLAYEFPVTCDVSKGGGFCRNRDVEGVLGMPCPDYEVRYECPITGN